MKRPKRNRCGKIKKILAEDAVFSTATASMHLVQSHTNQIEDMVLTTAALEDVLFLRMQ
jgi:hypothetical protein